MGGTLSRGTVFTELFLFTLNVNEEKERERKKMRRKNEERERNNYINSIGKIRAELRSSIARINRSNVLLKLVKPYLSYNANVMQERSFSYIYNKRMRAKRKEIYYHDIDTRVPYKR